MIAANSTIDGINASVVDHNTLLAFGILNLFLCLVASVLCVILIAATTLPLLYPKRRKAYSTYNLYLAYLSIPDLAVNVFIAYLLFVNTNWSFDGTGEDNSMWFYVYPYDDAIYPLCATANLYTNAFLTYEIFRLLRNSNRRKRSYPPTIGKVTKQAMFSYGMGIFIFIFDFYLIADRLDNNVWSVSPKVLKFLHVLYWAFSWSFCIVIPLAALILVSWKIYGQGLIGSTKSLYEGRLRVLTLFFLRIVFIDILIWMPCSVAYTIQWIAEDKRTKIIAYNTSLLFSGVQVMVNFGCALTKPDTKKLILDLLTGQYFRCEGDGENEEEEGDNEGLRTSVRGRRDPFLRTSLSFLRPASSGTEGTTPMSRNFSLRNSIRSLATFAHDDVNEACDGRKDIETPNNPNDEKAVVDESDHSDDTVEVRNPGEHTVNTSDDSDRMDHSSDAEHNTLDACDTAVDACHPCNEVNTLDASNQVEEVTVEACNPIDDIPDDCNHSLCTEV